MKLELWTCFPAINVMLNFCQVFICQVYKLLKKLRDREYCWNEYRLFLTVQTRSNYLLREFKSIGNRFSDDVKCVSSREKRYFRVMHIRNDNDSSFLHKFRYFLIYCTRESLGWPITFSFPFWQNICRRNIGMTLTYCYINLLITT